MEHVARLFAEYGACDYIGEDITQLEHAVQTATKAINDEYLHVFYPEQRKFVILAALLHDIGHLVAMRDGGNVMVGHDGSSLGATNHEDVGANYLASLGFPHEVCELVRMHVRAKRYLASCDGYTCSPASASTLRQQGGAMHIYEATLFQRDKLFSLAVLLRTYDDSGKDDAMSRESYTVQDFERILREYAC